MAKSPVDLFYVIYLNGTHVGTTKLGIIYARHRTAGLLYIIGVRQHFGKSIAGLSIAAMTEIGFLHPNQVKICASINTKIIGSLSGLGKNGFKLKGVKKHNIYAKTSG